MIHASKMQYMYQERRHALQYMHIRTKHTQLMRRVRTYAVFTYPVLYYASVLNYMFTSVGLIRNRTDTYIAATKYTRAQPHYPYLIKLIKAVFVAAKVRVSCAASVELSFLSMLLEHVAVLAVVRGFFVK